MLRMEQWMDIKLLHQQGQSIKAICRMTGFAKNTVRKSLRQKCPSSFRKSQRKSKLDNFKPYIKERFDNFGLSAVRLWDELRSMGYQGSLANLRRFVATLKPQKKVLQKLTVRFETPPGKQAQVDWAYCGRHTNQQGQSIPVYAFVMVLSFSRMLFVHFTGSMDVHTLLDCHLKAFKFLGGWSQSILYDNMKQIKLNLDSWNPMFLDFANYYGIVPKTHAVRRPRTKGKVERIVRYIRDNFLKGRSFADWNDLNLQALSWLNTTANTRIHSTTGMAPLSLWPKENLSAWNSIKPYCLSYHASRKVSSESWVYFERSRYSVPPKHVGKTVLVQLADQKVIIKANDMIIAEHTQVEKPGDTVSDPSHIEKLWELSLKRTPEPLPSWQLRFDESVQTMDLTQYQEVVL